MRLRELFNHHDFNPCTTNCSVSDKELNPLSNVIVNPFTVNESSLKLVSISSISGTMDLSVFTFFPPTSQPDIAPVSILFSSKPHFSRKKLFGIDSISDIIRFIRSDLEVTAPDVALLIASSNIAGPSLRLDEINEFIKSIITSCGDLVNEPPKVLVIRLLFLSDIVIYFPLAFFTIIELLSCNVRLTSLPDTNESLISDLIFMVSSPPYANITSFPPE